MIWLMGGSLAITFSVGATILYQLGLNDQLTGEK